MDIYHTPSGAPTNKVQYIHFTDGIRGHHFALNQLVPSVRMFLGGGFMEAHLRGPGHIFVETAIKVWKLPFIFRIMCVNFV